MEKNNIPMQDLEMPADELAAPTHSEIEELAERSESLEQRVSSLNDSYETLKMREVELTEWREVLLKAGEFFNRVGLIRRLHDANIIGSWAYGRDPTQFYGC